MLKLILINFILTITLLAVVEGSFFYLSSRNKAEPGPEIEEISDKEYYQDDELLGYKPLPNLQVQTKKVKGEETIYDVLYSFDQFATRQVGSRLNEGAFVLFVGDSNVFGEGVNDDQTLPFEFSKLISRGEVLNYAFRGYGPTQILALTESDRLPDEVRKERKGLVIYPYKFNGARRVVGTTIFFRWSSGHHPYYEWVEGRRLKRRGDFSSSVYYWMEFLKLINQSHFFNWFDKEFPDPYSSTFFPKVCQTLVQIQENLLEKLPRSQFVVALRNLHSMKGKKVRDCLERSEIAWVDISEAFEGEEDRERWYLHKWDGHDSAWAHKKNAEVLYRELHSKGLLNFID